jgi:hypothetical protein
MAAVLILVAIICNDSLTVSEFYCFHILIWIAITFNDLFIWAGLDLINTFVFKFCI